MNIKEYLKIAREGDEVIINMPGYFEDTPGVIGEICKYVLGGINIYFWQNKREGNRGDKKVQGYKYSWELCGDEEDISIKMITSETKIYELV